jgi:hypothetical protein
MKRWRHVLVAAWLAFALVAGQQLVVLHALGHATDRINDKDATATCKVHFACSQLASIVGAKTAPVLPIPSSVHALNGARDLPGEIEPSFAFLSRGPPIAFV